MIILSFSFALSFTPNATLTCEVINTCAIYGFSGKPANSLSCTSSVNTRTITCLPGFYATAPSNPAVTLTGNSAFGGCIRMLNLELASRLEIDNCAVYGNSGKPQNVANCANGINYRTITCAAGYAAVLPSTVSIKLTASTVFAGCQGIALL